MIAVWFVLLIEMCILNLMGEVFKLTDVFYFIAILLNMVVLVIVLARKMYKDNKQIFILVFFNTIMKLILAYLIVYYYEKVKFIPHLGRDERAFFTLATNLSRDLTGFSNKIRGGAYVKLFSLIFRFIGSNKFFGQYINILLFLTSYMIYYDNFRKVNSLALDLLILFLPHQFIITSSFLRESMIIFFVTLSLKYFLVENYSKTNILLAIFFNLIASMFHSGVIVMSMVYVFVFIFYSPEKDKLNYGAKSFLIFFLMVIFISSLYYLFEEFIDTKLLQKIRVDSFEQFASVGNYIEGGSQYLGKYKVNKPKDLLLFIPLKAIYFIGSPFPWDWRGIKDILSFVFDTLFYLTPLLISFFNMKKVRKNIFNYSVLWILILSIIVYGYGTFNAGTAIRHRGKFIFLYAYLWEEIISYIKGKTKKNLVKRVHKS